MSKVVQAHRFKQNYKNKAINSSSDSHQKPQFHDQYESGAPGTAQSKSGFSRSIDASVQRPFTQATKKKINHLSESYHQQPNVFESLSLNDQNQTINSAIPNSELYNRNKVLTLAKAIGKKDQVIKAQRAILSRMYSKLNNFQKNYKITRNILKRLKGKLIENGIPLPDVEDDQQQSDLLLSNATVQDRLEQALIGYQNIQKPQQDSKKNTAQISIMSGGAYDPQVLSDYDNFVLKQLEKAQLRSLSKQQKRNTSQSRENSQEKYQFSSKKKHNADLNESQNNYAAGQQNQRKFIKREQRNVIVKRVNKARPSTNMKQRAISTGRGIAERFP